MKQLKNKCVDQYRAIGNIFSMLFAVALCSPLHVMATDNIDHSAQLTNWAYAAFQGSGIYKINDHKIGVLSLPLSYSFNDSKPKQGQGIFELTYPIIIGVYDFDIKKYGLHHLDDRLGTLSFVPGLHFHYSVYDSWIVTPFVDAGIGWAFSDSKYSWIYSAGLESRYFFDINNNNFMLGNRIRWAGHTLVNTDGADEYVSFESIVEYLIDTPWQIFNRKIDFTVFGSNQLNFDAKVLNDFSGDHPDLKVLWEVGTSVGFLTDDEEDFFHSLRVGIGYQFGDDVQAITFVIGDVF